MPSLQKDTFKKGYFTISVLLAKVSQVCFLVFIFLLLVLPVVAVASTLENMSRYPTSSLLFSITIIIIIIIIIKVIIIIIIIVIIIITTIITMNGSNP